MIERYIQAIGHLSDMPSASQVQQTGVNLGEMNAKLLQKIEELTLHLIRLDKENTLQRKDIDVLKSTIARSTKIRH